MYPQRRKVSGCLSALDEGWTVEREQHLIAGGGRQLELLTLEFLRAYPQALAI